MATCRPGMVFRDGNLRQSIGFPEARVLFSRLSRHGRLRQLQLLLALQQCGSIGRAAAQLDMSQSAATQALNELERVLDLRLFERHARGIRPTQAGQALIDTARGIMSALEDVSETLSAIRTGASSTLRLGAIPAAAYSILGPLLARFQAAQPQVHVSVQEDEGTRLLSQLFAGGLDAVFCRQPSLLPDSLVFEPLFADEAVFVAAATHPLAHHRRIPLVALSDARWVLPTSNIEVRDIFQRVVLAQLPQAHWFPVSTTSLPVLSELLSQPGAVALSPRSIVPSLKHANPHTQIEALDVLADPQALAMGRLGVVYSRAAAPQGLRALLAALPAASDSAP